jgi:hypothetical protein
MWDRGGSCDSVGHALLLLRFSQEARGDVVDEHLAATQVGHSNVHLLELCRCLLGLSRLSAVADCPKCGKMLDTSIAIDPLLQCLRMNERDQSATTTGASIEAMVGDFEFSLRVAELSDLHAAARAGNTLRARRALLDRCVRSVKRESLSPLTIEDVPPDVLDAVSEQLSRHDPVAELNVAIKCPECSHPFEAGLDPAAFAWSALESMARRLQTEVVTLAEAFGWTESEVLALTPRRRQTYLNLLSDRE